MQNRLLALIRQQQAQIATLQATPNQPASSTSAVDDSTPTSERSLSLAGAGSTGPPSSIALPRPRSPLPLSRNSSHHRSGASSGAASPALHAQLASAAAATADLSLGGPAAVAAAARDDAAFYQAETLMLSRENQMLKLRVRELERVLADLERPPAHHQHAAASALARSASVSAGAGAGGEEGGSAAV